MNENMRLFVAIALPPEVREALSAFRRELEKGLSSVRWVKIEGIHLTLRFLGDVPEERLPEIREALARCAPASGEEGIMLDAAGVGVFPHTRAPRVLWIGFPRVPDPLARLQQRVEERMVRLGFPGEHRPFRPHLTLGRFRRQLRRTEREVLSSILARDQQRRFGEFTASRFSLYRSILGPGGARYDVVEGWPLAPTGNG